MLLPVASLVKLSDVQHYQWSKTDLRSKTDLGSKTDLDPQDAKGCSVTVSKLHNVLSQSTHACIQCRCSSLVDHSGAMQGLPAPTGSPLRNGSIRAMSMLLSMPKQCGTTESMAQVAHLEPVRMAQQACILSVRVYPRICTAVPAAEVVNLSTHVTLVLQWQPFCRPWHQATVLVGATNT
jgi:hypothetical protein